MNKLNFVFNSRGCKQMKTHLYIIQTYINENMILFVVNVIMISIGAYTCTCSIVVLLYYIYMSVHL